MGTKPTIALIGLFWTGMALSGCESCDACRANKPWGQDKVTASTVSTSNPNSVAANSMNSNPSRPAPSSSLTQPMSGTPMSQSVRITDPGVNPATLSVPGSSSSTSAAAMTPTGIQPATQYSGVPATATSANSFDAGSRTMNVGNTAAPQPGWPSAAPVGTGTGMSPSNPSPVNTTATGDSSYQTRYPQLQPVPTVPTMPKPGSGPGE